MKTLIETLYAFCIGSLIAGLFGFAVMLWVIGSGKGDAASALAASQICRLSLSAFVLAIFFGLWSSLADEEPNQ